MEIPRGKPVDIGRAAERSGYGKREVELLVSAPSTILNFQERSEVMHFGADVADKLVHLLDGKDVDWHELVRLGAQLRSMSPSENPEKHEDELELQFEEEQKLLLIKNLVEDAFFDGKLAHLHGQSAAALAFLINRIAKLVDNMTPLVRQDFLFDKAKMDALIEQAREAEKADLPERIEKLRQEKQIIEDRIMNSDFDGMGADLAFNKKVYEEKFKKYDTFELKKEELEFLEAFKALTKLVKGGLDNPLLKDLPGKEIIRKVLNCVEYPRVSHMLHGLHGRSSSPETIGIFHPSLVKDLVTKTDVIWPVNDWKLEIVSTVANLEKIENDIAKLPDNKRMVLRQVSAWLAMLLRGCSADLVEKLKVDREGPEILERYDERLRQMCEERPLLAKERDDVVLALKDVESEMYSMKIDGRTTKYYNGMEVEHASAFAKALNDYRESRKDEYGEMQPHQFTADLYLMKAYLVAADMYNRQGEERTATADNKAGKDIFTYRFSDTGREDKGFADVHFKVTQSPLAEAMVRAQVKVEKKKN
ncbi:TPA: hypothetical protein DEP96_00790 [Candidatus Uhrbacteria bacterium]|nr:hypothetical protein [Candidatus Uhrbacteria bacterium]